MNVAYALHIMLSFLVVVLKPVNNPVEVTVRSGLEKTLSFQSSGEFPQLWWSDHS